MTRRVMDPANVDRHGDEIHPWNVDRGTYAAHCTVSGCGEYIDDVPDFPGVDYIGPCHDTLPE